MSEYQNNSIFWVETTKINPNPFQPRRDFEPRALEDLADSIRQYGVLQPLVVTRKETLRPDHHGMDVHYELIAGERRLRASKIAGLAQVPVIIRKETDDKVKLELAIIENLQREDLNPIDRALAFEQLYKQFNLTHVQIGKKMGKSRVYVSNSLRLLSLPEEIKKGLMAGKISEGHTRPLLMLTDRPQEQTTLYKEIMIKKMSVRDAEKVARSIAQDKVRKKEFIIDPRIRDFEKKLSENLGTRVQIEPKENGGQITIDYFTLNDLEEILLSMKKVEREKNMMDRYIAGTKRNMDNKASEKKQVQSIMNATGINISDSVTPESSKIQRTITQHHDALPGYEHAENTDIEVFHKSLPEYKKQADTDIQEFKKNIDFTDQQALEEKQVDDIDAIQIGTKVTETLNSVDTMVNFNDDSNVYSIPDVNKIQKEVEEVEEVESFQLNSVTEEKPKEIPKIGFMEKRLQEYNELLLSRQNAITESNEKKSVTEDTITGAPAAIIDNTTIHNPETQNYFQPEFQPQENISAVNTGDNTGDNTGEKIPNSGSVINDITNSIQQEFNNRQKDSGDQEQSTYTNQTQAQTSNQDYSYSSDYVNPQQVLESQNTPDYSAQDYTQNQNQYQPRQKKKGFFGNLFN